MLARAWCSSLLGPKRDSILISSQHEERFSSSMTLRHPIRWRAGGAP
jgi:hypothetical protein